MPAPKGHPRWGGKKKGKKNKGTLEKEAALQLLQQGILKEIRPLLRAALDSAKGLTVMLQRKMVKQKDGKFRRTGELVRVRSIERVEELLKGDCQGDNYFYITTRDPNIKAIEDLLNRAFGKPKEQVDFGFDKEAMRAIQDSNKNILEMAKELAKARYNNDKK